jgi:hypothetical protein
VQAGANAFVRGSRREAFMRWLLRVALVGLVVGLAIPAAAAPAATTIEKGIPFEATIEACGETITLSGTLLGVFIEQPLG